MNQGLCASCGDPTAAKWHSWCPRCHAAEVAKIAPKPHIVTACDGPVPLVAAWTDHRDTVHPYPSTGGGSRVVRSNKPGS